MTRSRTRSGPQGAECGSWTRGAARAGAAIDAACARPGADATDHAAIRGESPDEVAEALCSRVVDRSARSIAAIERAASRRRIPNPDSTAEVPHDHRALRPHRRRTTPGRRV